MYARDKASSTGGTLTKTTGSGYGSQVLSLAGVNKSAVSAFSFSYDSSYIITGGSVTINSHVYTLTITKGVPSWSAV